MNRFYAKSCTIALLALSGFPAWIFLALSAQTEYGSFTVAPIRGTEPSGLGGFCDPPQLSLKIDSRQTVPWPRKEPLNIEDLELAQSHLVVAVCNGKPLQSFRFRFAEFKSRGVCLTFGEYLFDGYQGLRLWDAKHAPWCKHD
jgi:hypothetical protein